MAFHAARRPLGKDQQDSDTAIDLGSSLARSDSTHFSSNRTGTGLLPARPCRVPFLSRSCSVVKQQTQVLYFLHLYSICQELHVGVPNLEVVGVPLSHPQPLAGKHHPGPPCDPLVSSDLLVSEATVTSPTLRPETASASPDRARSRVGG